VYTQAVETERTTRWLDAAAAALAEASGAEMTLSSDDVAALLEAARVAAHESGAKLNAPLVTFLVGRASLGAGQSVEELVELVRSATAPAAVTNGAA